VLRRASSNGQERVLVENVGLDISKPQIEDERPKIGNRDVQFAHASVDAIGDLSILAVRGHRLQLETDGEKPANGTSLQFLSNSLPVGR
jgi:hypothetical protein